MLDQVKMIQVFSLVFFYTIRTSNRLRMRFKIQVLSCVWRPTAKFLSFHVNCCGGPRCICAKRERDIDIRRTNVRIILTFQFQYNAQLCRFRARRANWITVRQHINCMHRPMHSNSTGFRSNWSLKTVSRWNDICSALALNCMAQRTSFHRSMHTSSVLFFLLTPLNQIRPIHENRKLLSTENVNEMHAAHRWNIILQQSWRLDFKANHMNCQSFWMSTYIAISFSQSHTNIHLENCKTLTFNISDINEQKRVDRLKLSFDLKLIGNTKKEQKQKANCLYHKLWSIILTSWWVKAMDYKCPQVGFDWQITRAINFFVAASDQIQCVSCAGTFESNSNKN